MNPDQTQRQNDVQQQRSQELSRQRSRPPIEVPGYDARHFLGAGAYGEVWVALDQNTGRKVAIKFYTQRSGVDWSQLSREVEKLVFLSADRYVVQLLDVGWNSDPPYYVMEYVDGGSLQQRLDAEGSLGVGEAVETFREVATGLLHAHGKGVLHCDLKPANILLDEDHKPRLADFGQSRLSHEQTPALGTLFYMAPEQADLKAVPDARWDVYALGAMLYSMLTGGPPHRTDELLSEIDTAPNLSGRLERYREKIETSPPPAAHRQVRKVDRELADIIDRCLHVDPQRRFPNVQSVLTALRNRDATRDRRPLLLLGLLGPLVFLMVLGTFGFSAARKSVNESGNVLRRWTLESSRFAAKFVAETAARRLEGYFQLAERQAEDESIQELLLDISSDLELEALIRQLHQRNSDPNSFAGEDDPTEEDEQQAARDTLLARPELVRLQKYVDKMLARSIVSNDNVDSWFITDARGIQLAAKFRGRDAPASIGRDYSFRNYFHGGDEDLESEQHHDLPPLEQTRLSTVFQSSVTRTWKVAVSTPILAPDGGPVGVVALTVELGGLGTAEEFSADDGRFVTLVDGRQGSRGVILQHPLFTKIIDSGIPLPDRITQNPDYRVKLDTLPTSDETLEDIPLYRDPFAAEDPAYDKMWIAAQEPVLLDSDDEASGETGLVVLVQENYDQAVMPVQELGEKVMRDAQIALATIVVSLVVLWWLVTRALQDPNEALRRGGGPQRKAASLHSMETLELPEQLRDFPRS